MVNTLFTPQKHKLAQNIVKSVQSFFLLSD